MAIQQPSYHQYKFYNQTQFHMVKGIDNAFHHMEMSFVLQAEEYSRWKLAYSPKKLIS